MKKKKTFLEGWSWFKFNNLGVARGMALKFLKSVAKGSKLNVRKLCDFYKRKTVRGKGIF